MQISGNYLPRTTSVKAVLSPMISVERPCLLAWYIPHFAPGVGNPGSSWANTTRAVGTWSPAQFEHELAYGCPKLASGAEQMDRLPS